MNYPKNGEIAEILTDEEIIALYWNRTLI